MRNGISRVCALSAIVLTCMFSAQHDAHADTARGAAFTDQTAELGLSALDTRAACCVDIDNDGWVDLVAGGTVWKNNQGKGFTRVMDGVGFVVAADFDNDGFADLFSWSNMKLYRNEMGKAFTEFPLPTNLPKTDSQGACWGDFDNNGFADLFIGGFEDWKAGITYPSMILMNWKGKAFTLTWSDAQYRTRGVTACDFNRDGKLDVYVSNYRLQPNLLYLNDGAGRFRDAAAAYNAVATSKGFKGGHSIGAAWGDFDNDGNIDLFAGNFAHVDFRGDQPKSRFLRNLGATEDYHFDDLGTCGVFHQESYASPAAGDYDNDGYLDLFFTTVYATASFGRRNDPVLYHNDGRFVFKDKTAATNLSNLGSTYQAAWADFNNDGNLDLVSGGKLLMNSGGNGNDWIEISLHGDGRVVNSSAIGAQVRIKVRHEILTRQVEAGTGEGNQNDLRLHFGLGRKVKSVDLDITWPNGAVQILKNVKTDCMLSIAYKPTN